jgi:hypothetical protein
MDPDEYLDLKAPSSIQAKSWAKTLKVEREKVERASLRRSTRARIKSASGSDFSLSENAPPAAAAGVAESGGVSMADQMALEEILEQEEEDWGGGDDLQEVEEEPDVTATKADPRKKKMHITCPTLYDGIQETPSYSRDEAYEFARQVVTDHNGFSVLSFNLLANTYVENSRTPTLYRHCDVDCLPWSFREREILKHLAVVCPDIICLQECEEQVFEATGRIGGALRRAGYAGEWDYNEGKDGKQIPGRATFYRKKVFELAWRERSYRSLVIGLRIKNGAEKGSVVACVNSHLEGAMGRWKDRHSQMRSALKKVAQKQSQGEVRFVFVCGDFNDGATSDLLDALVHRIASRVRTADLAEQLADQLGDEIAAALPAVLAERLRSQGGEGQGK